VERKSPWDRLLLLLNDYVRRPKVSGYYFPESSVWRRQLTRWLWHRQRDIDSALRCGVSGVSDSIAAWTLRDKASISVRTGQQLQHRGDRGKAWPKQLKVSVTDEKRVSCWDANTMRA